MAFGKPIIGGKHGGTPDLIEDGNASFPVECVNVSALSDRIVRLLSDHNLRHRKDESFYVEARKP